MAAPVTAATADELAAGQARLSDGLLALHERLAAAGADPDAWAGASAAAWRQAGRHVHRYGCLFLALDRLADQVAATTDPAELTALLAAPCCEVVLTAATGEPVRVERLRVNELVAAADTAQAAVLAIIEAHTGAQRAVRAELDRLVELAGADPVPAGDLADLARQGGADPVGCAAPGPWRDAAAALAGRLTPAADRPAALAAERRAELRGRLAAYRQKAIDEGRGEDLGLDRLYRTARETLRRSPGDIAAADDAVWAYQCAVNGRSV